MAKRIVIPVPVRCPIDGGLLRPNGSGQSVIESCPVCGGIWVSARALRRLQGSSPELRVHLAGRLRGQPAMAPVLAKHCSTCEATPLGVCRVNGVELDVCAKCGGLWLDRGELEALKRRRMTFSGLGLAVGDAVLEAVFQGVLEALL
jgi:Zn-finger nucleic acid-binding protein